MGPENRLSLAARIKNRIFLPQDPLVADIEKKLKKLRRGKLSDPAKARDFIETVIVDGAIKDSGGDLNILERKIITFEEEAGEYEEKFRQTGKTFDRLSAEIYRRAANRLRRIFGNMSEPVEI